MAFDPMQTTVMHPGVCGCSDCMPKPTRRGVLAAAGGALLAATLSRPVWAAAPALTPDAALERLMAGNKRYAGGHSVSRSADFAALRRATVGGQHPFATVLGCVDSRVPVSLVFDQAIGDIFTCRVAGNICAPDMAASIEFGVAEAHTPLVMVLGHQSCGAVTAALSGESAPGQIDSLFMPLQPAIEKAGRNVDAVVKANALIQANLLRAGSRVIAEAEKRGKVKVVAAYYSLADGSVMLLG